MSSGKPPDRFYMHESMVSREQIRGLQQLVRHSAGEREIDAFISANRQLLTLPLDFARTGHHGAWVVPKAAIRSGIHGTVQGMIPDFLVGGESSDGISWLVVELKGAGARLFSGSGNKVRFSPDANRGICQTLEYIDYCARAQAHLRDEMQLAGLREPMAYLILGREEETESDRLRDLKAAWNRRMGGAVSIRSYDSLLRVATRLAESYDRRGG